MMSADARDYFASMDPDRLLKQKERLEWLINRETGKLPNIRPVMPWMVSPWKKSLEIINEIITRRAQ